MFAVLGDIIFEVLDSPTAFESTLTWDYSEHQVVEDRPKLQWLAEALETIDLDLHFHVSFVDPALQLAGLIAAADDHSARALVLGNGVHRGYFVVTSIHTTAQQMTANGNLIAITVRTRLKEWPIDSEGSGLMSPVPPFPIIGVVAAPPGATTSSIVYSDGAGVGATAQTAGPSFVPFAIAAPRVSALLSLPRVAGLTAPQLSLGDVPPRAIVRAPG